MRSGHRKQGWWCRRSAPGRHLRKDLLEHSRHLSLLALLDRHLSKDVLEHHRYVRQESLRRLRDLHRQQQQRRQLLLRVRRRAQSSRQSFCRCGGCWLRYNASRGTRTTCAGTWPGPCTTRKAGFVVTTLMLIEGCIKERLRVALLSAAL